MNISDFSTYTGEMTAMLVRFAAIESPSTDKSAVDRMGAAVEAELQALGARITHHPQTAAGDHLEARWGEQVQQTAPLLILCHMDTVFELGTLAHFPLRQENGALHGPGVFDMKGGIVVLLYALRHLLATGVLKRPVTALFTSDEETGSATSRRLIEDLARQ